jgi:hypothetical protein
MVWKRNPSIHCKNQASNRLSHETASQKPRTKADWRPLDRDIRWHGKENVIEIGRNTLNTHFE